MTMKEKTESSAKWGVGFNLTDRGGRALVRLIFRSWS